MKTGVRRTTHLLRRGQKFQNDDFHCVMFDCWPSSCSQVAAVGIGRSWLLYSVSDVFMERLHTKHCVPSNTVTAHLLQRLLLHSRLWIYILKGY